MIPLWKAAPAIACGNAFILKPSEAAPLSVPLRLAELFLEAGGPPGIFNVVNGDKEAVDAILTDPRIQRRGLRRLHPDRAVHLRDRRRARQAGTVLRWRQEPRDRHARRRSRRGRRRADRCRLRQRRRALHGHLRRRTRRRGDSRSPARQAGRARREAQRRTQRRRGQRLRTAHHGRGRPARHGLRADRCRRGVRSLVVDGRGFSLAGARERVLPPAQRCSTR